MIDITQSEEVEYTKENAKVKFDKGDYPLSKVILEKLWKDSNKDNVYLLYDYGRTLRKVNESIKFVEIYSN